VGDGTAERIEMIDRLSAPDVDRIMFMDVKLWGILHDGGVERMTGTLPGNVVFHVWLEWVAKEFPPSNGVLTITLHDCSDIEYTEFGSDVPYIDVAGLQGLDIEILGATRQGDWATVNTALGRLRVRYTDVTVQLDNGTIVTLDELTTAVRHDFEKFVG